jgi:CRP-like cAMP-binding protein
MSTALESRSLTENRILSALPFEDYERLAPHLERVEMPHGQVLCKAGDLIEHVYFPINSMISLVSQLSDGSGAEVGLTGYEGMSGLSIVLGVKRSPHEAMVQIHDGAMRLRADVLLNEFKRGGALQRLLLRYTQSLLLQISQIAACNRLHSVEERLARWLLMSHDRCVCEDLPLTHEFIALMLGVRRAGVTTAAIALQAEGYINYKRGHITITDRKGLEDFACECYRIIKAEFDSIISGTENAGGINNKREDEPYIFHSSYDSNLLS